MDMLMPVALIWTVGATNGSNSNITTKSIDTKQKEKCETHSAARKSQIASNKLKRKKKTRSYSFSTCSFNFSLYVWFFFSCETKICLLPCFLVYWLLVVCRHCCWVLWKESISSGNVWQNEAKRTINILNSQHNCFCFVLFGSVMLNQANNIRCYNLDNKF